MGDNKLNLGGLNVAFWGTILMMVSSLVSSLVSGISGSDMSIATMDFSSPTTIVSLVCSGLVLIGLIMVIAGLSRAKTASDRFRKARNRYVLNILTGILAAVAFVAGIVMIIGAAGDDSSSGQSGQIAGAGAVLMAVALVLLLVAVLFQMLFIKNLMGGCAEVAKLCEDKSYSGKCTRTWVFYILFMLASAICMVAAVITGGTSLISSAESAGGAITSVLGNVSFSSTTGILIIATLVTGVLSVIFYIIAVFRMRGTYKRFNGHEVATEQPTFESQPVGSAAGASAANPFASGQSAAAEDKEPDVQPVRSKVSEEVSETAESAETAEIAEEAVGAEEAVETAADTVEIEVEGGSEDSATSLQEKVDELQAMIDEVNEAEK